jgi:hypothetical protein
MSEKLACDDGRMESHGAPAVFRAVSSRIERWRVSAEAPAYQHNSLALGRRQIAHEGATMTETDRTMARMAIDTSPMV